MTSDELDEFEATFAFEPSPAQWAVLLKPPEPLPCPGCAGPAVEGRFAVGHGMDLEHEVVRTFCFYCRMDLNVCATHGGASVTWGES